MSRLLTPQEYADVLAQRMADHVAQHPPRPGLPPLLEWFIRDGDEGLVDMGAIEAQNRVTDDRPKGGPRRYRPASYWRDRLARIDARLASIDGVGRHDTTDRAAYGGIGIRQTPRQRARYAAVVDRAAADHVRLTRQREHAARMLRAAQAREADAEDDRG